MERWELARLTDSMLTGVSQIDSQHQVLINILNEMAAEVTSPSDARRFDRVTRDLLAYVITHFEAEEQLIRESGYAIADPDGARAHIGQHRGFADRVLALRARAADGDAASQADLLAFLRDWLFHHIATTDQNLGRFVGSRHISRV